MSLREQAIPVLWSALAGLCVFLLVSLLPGERPNVVIIVVDTLRADAISTRPGAGETPNIAQLAAGGVVFPMAYSHAPMTLPAHASLFSGRHPYETGVYNNGERIPDDVPLLAESLRDAGYQTVAAVSLATLWPFAMHQGLDRGFDLFDTGTAEVAPAEDTTPRLAQVLDSLDPSRPFFLFAHLSDPHEPYNEHAPWFDGSREGNTADVLFDGEGVDVVTTSAMSWWEREVDLAPGAHRLTIRSEAPFKLRSLQVVGPHGPLEPTFLQGGLLEANTEMVIEFTNPSEEVRRVELRAWINDVPSSSAIFARYASEVGAADAAIGQLVAELRERGLWDNTIVILTSDHGEALGEHGAFGHVVNLYDELLHVPLIIRLPHDDQDERLNAAKHSLVRHIDVAPTILQRLNLPNLEGSAGESLFQPAERLLMAETHPPEAPKTLFALRDETYKLVFDPQGDSFEMFRLGPDPLELDNVFSHQGHLRETWELVLRKLAARVEPAGARDEETQRRLTALGY